MRDHWNAITGSGVSKLVGSEHASKSPVNSWPPRCMAAFDLQDFMQDFGGIQHKLLAEAEKNSSGRSSEVSTRSNHIDVKINWKARRRSSHVLSMFERCFDQPTTKPSSSTWQMSPAGQRLLIIMNQVSWQLFHVNANSKDKAPRGKWDASPPQPILPGRSQTPRDQHYGNTPGYVLRGTMGSGLGHVQHIPTYSNIFQHIPTYSNIFQHAYRPAKMRWSLGALFCGPLAAAPRSCCKGRPVGVHADLQSAEHGQTSCSISQ